jgi:hypothetical protein
VKLDSHLEWFDSMETRFDTKNNEHALERTFQSAQLPPEETTMKDAGIVRLTDGMTSSMDRNQNMLGHNGPISFADRHEVPDDNACLKQLKNTVDRLAGGAGPGQFADIMRDLVRV